MYTFLRHVLLSLTRFYFIDTFLSLTRQGLCARFCTLTTMCYAIDDDVVAGEKNRKRNQETKTLSKAAPTPVQRLAGLRFKVSFDRAGRRAPISLTATKLRTRAIFWLMWDMAASMAGSCSWELGTWVPRLPARGACAHGV